MWWEREHGAPSPNLGRIDDLRFFGRNDISVDGDSAIIPGSLSDDIDNAGVCSHLHTK